MVAFKKATRTQKKLRCALLGPPGSGKTRTALEMAKGLGDKIALIDTEHGSATMYAHIIEFDTIELMSFAPDRYIEAIDAAEAAGYDVLVIDSLSHAWSGKGGILEFVDRTKKGNNSFNAWGDATPLHNKLVERLLTCKLHLIVTMRTKMEHVQERDERTGKTTIRKVGMQPVQRDGMEYEFDVICDLDQQHTLTVSKTRIDTIDGESISKPSAEFGKRLRAFLDAGAAPVVAVAAPAIAKESVADLRKAIGIELDRLLVGAGMPDTGRQAARTAVVKRISGGVKIDTIEQCRKVLAELREEPTPEELPPDEQGGREPGSDDDRETEG